MGLNADMTWPAIDQLVSSLYYYHQARTFSVDVFRKLRAAPKRSRGGIGSNRGQHGYSNLDNSNTSSNAVPWYWRAIAGVAVLMILGGFLMLPATFDSDPLLRVARSVVGIFAVALLTAGFSLTGLLAFAVRDLGFQAEAIFLPALTSCALGLLTIFYDFLISSRFSWTTPALLLTIAAAVSTVIYGSLLLWTYRRIALLRPRSNHPHPLSLDPSNPLAANHPQNSPYQPQGYYENYVRNMYPASSHQQIPPANYNNSDSPYNNPPNITMTEEEMQRQQMLMLLLTRDQAPTPDPTQSTFHIDWQGGQEQQQPDENDNYHYNHNPQLPPGTPVNGYYAPASSQPNSAFPPQSAFPQSASVYSPAARPGLARQWTSEGMRPWDGVLRGVVPRQNGGLAVRERGSHEEREERRRQIEMGYR